MSIPSPSIPPELVHGLALAPEYSAADPHGYYPEAELSGGLPINLDSLRDGPPGSKPFYPYSTLIRYAIKGSPAGKLLLEDIYYAIESRFPYFRTAPAGWKNSVRHNLSLNPCFVKVARPLTDRGKGSYWTVDDNVDPRTGVHRVRKKKTKKSKADGTEEQASGSGLGSGLGSGSGEFAEVAEFAGPPEPFQDADAAAAAAAAFAQAVPGMEEDGQSQSQAQAYAATGFSPAAAYDPAYQMQLLMRYQIPMAPDEQLPLDASGQIDWRMAWHNELASLQRMTVDNDKASVGEDWYRNMFFRLRAGIFSPFNPADLFAAPPGQVQQGMVVDGQEVVGDVHEQA